MADLDKTADELFAEAVGLARNGAAEEDVRKAWIRYECCCWYDAHVERGLNICDLPREHREGVFELIKAKQNVALDAQHAARKANQS